MSHRLWVTLAIAALAILSPGVVPAQWRADLQAGRIRSTLDPSAHGTESVVAGLGYEDLTTAFRISTGIPTRPEAPYWGAFGASRRLAFRVRGFIAGVDVAGNGFYFQDRTGRASPGGGLLGPLPDPAVDRSGHALAGQVLPLLGFETGQVQIQGRAGVSYYTVTSGEQRGERTVKLGDIQIVLQPSPTFALVPVVRAFQAENEETATFAGLSGVVAHGRASFWGNAGQWLGGADTAWSAQTAWGAGGSFRLTDRVTANASARGDGFDPLYLRPPQTSWSAGLSFHFGGRPNGRAAPVPAVYERGLATIRLPASQASAPPSVAGDFNGWTPARMQRAGEFWSYTVAVAPGAYNYSFVSADGEWFVPKDVPGRKDDGMGGYVAVLVVG